MPKPKPTMYGLMAEFESPDELVAAIHKLREKGYKRLEAYTPFPIEEVWEALGFHHNRLPLIVLIGGILGGLGGYFLQYFTSVMAYPLNIGGRPFHSWPAFIPVTFETTVLGAALSAVLGMLALNGLPMPHHPVFNVPRFALATKDRFFLCIEAGDPNYDIDTTRRLLDSMAPRQVSEVEY